MTTTWDPGQYLRFAAQRQRPFEELVARVPLDTPAAVVDLGCGPGTATATLADRWPGARVVGLDSSPEMIAEARPLSRPGRLEFVAGDVRQWAPDGPVDLVLSNALLQWVPGHADLLERFAGWLAPGGVLAFQVPANFETPVHTELRRLAGSGRWPVPLTGLLRDAPVLTAGGYLKRLQAIGLAADVWETTYYQVLTGPDPVLEWARGTALRPVLGALQPEAAAEFEQEYAAALRIAYPQDAAGRSVLPFRRIFAVGTTAP